MWPVQKQERRTAIYGVAHQGVLERELAEYPGRPSGVFDGHSAPVRVAITGSYTRLPHYPQYLAFVMMPSGVLWMHWLALVRLPFLMVVVLLAAGITLHLWIEHRLRQWEREREDAVAREMRLRDFYAALSQINQLIAHHPDPMQLFSSVCEIVVTHTYLKLAWIGLVDPVSQTPRVVASAGVAIGYVDGLELSVDPQVPEGRGPFGRALRSEQNLVIQDIATEPGFEPWRERAAQFGLVSSASFPFRRQGRVTGVMTVYSGAAGFFEPELAQLLEELAVDVSFSLEDYDRQQELLRLALHDNLTGLANRQLFLDRLTQALGLARRDERLVAVGIVDLDGYKQINDRLGHASGDEVLRQIAKRLQGSLRETDTLARLGGDEFGLILSSLCNVQEMHSVLHRCITAVASPLTLPGTETIALSASIGVAVYPFDEGEISSIVRHADLALYRAKEAGGNGFAFFEQPLEDEMLERHRARAEIQNAFRNREFVVYYQPQVHMGSGAVLGVEALVRWKHPERGLLMPDQFIEVIEEDLHFIRGLGRLVLEETCRQCRLWAAAGLHLKVSVNIGARHLLAPEFVGDITEVLSRHPETAERLMLEVTESDALADMEQSAQVLKECRRRGLKIAIDDFGSGYASLTYLQRLPVDQIKIDQGFVRGLLDDTRNIAIIASLINAA
ncbi:MAG TPA: EAL domain-containing protein, partial [Acidiferrobacteraceae bacterium]|nr:EAL domain-containing protein [Acidiferrobacteraceae bacterium]